MVTDIGVKTLVDIGCGRGASTAWFVTYHVQAQCVEGFHQAIETTLLPDPSQQLIEHDYTRGPWWPQTTQDAVWCVDFLEHVSRHFHHNVLPTFRKSALIFMTLLKPQVCSVPYVLLKQQYRTHCKTRMVISICKPIITLK